MASLAALGEQPGVSVLSVGCSVYFLCSLVLSLEVRGVGDILFMSLGVCLHNGPSSF